eukprot:scaffold77069_cov29-Prasinocladus_malaysianus.AAC.1
MEALHPPYCMLFMRVNYYLMVARMPLRTQPGRNSLIICEKRSSLTLETSPAPVTLCIARSSNRWKVEFVCRPLKAKIAIQRKPTIPQQDYR